VGDGRTAPDACRSATAHHAPREVHVSRRQFLAVPGGNVAAACQREPRRRRRSSFTSTPFRARVAPAAIFFFFIVVCQPPYFCASVANQVLRKVPSATAQYTAPADNIDDRAVSQTRAIRPSSFAALDYMSDFYAARCAIDSCLRHHEAAKGMRKRHAAGAAPPPCRFIAMPSRFLPRCRAETSPACLRGR